jgi:hypothetical protein
MKKYIIIYSGLNISVFISAHTEIYGIAGEGSISKLDKNEE